MLHRKRLTRKQRAYRAFKQQQPTGTGPSRAQRQAERRRREKAYQLFVRGQLEARVAKMWPGACACESCSTTQRQMSDLQMDERVPRSKTRRMPPEDRYDTRWCWLLCAGCHLRFTQNELSVACESIVAGLNGQRAIHPGTRAHWNATVEQVWDYARAHRTVEEVDAIAEVMS